MNDQQAGRYKVALAELDIMSNIRNFEVVDRHAEEQQYVGRLVVAKENTFVEVRYPGLAEVVAGLFACYDDRLAAARNDVRARRIIRNQMPRLQELLAG